MPHHAVGNRADQPRHEQNKPDDAPTEERLAQRVSHGYADDYFNENGDGCEDDCVPDGDLKIGIAKHLKVVAEANEPDGGGLIWGVVGKAVCQAKKRRPDCEWDNDQDKWEQERKTLTPREHRSFICHVTLSSAAAQGYCYPTDSARSIRPVLLTGHVD